MYECSKVILAFFLRSPHMQIIHCLTEIIGCDNSKVRANKWTYRKQIIYLLSDHLLLNYHNLIIFFNQEIEITA